MILSCFLDFSDFVVDLDDVTFSSTFVVLDTTTVSVFSYVDVFCFVVGGSIVGS